MGLFSLLLGALVIITVFNVIMFFTIRLVCNFFFVSPAVTVTFVYDMRGAGWVSWAGRVSLLLMLLLAGAPVGDFYRGVLVGGVGGGACWD